MFIPPDSLSGEIPFSRAGNLIIIRARVDEIEGNFVLDTGAPGLILNLTYFRHYPENTEMDAGDAQGGITGGTMAASTMLVADMQIGVFNYKRIPAHRIQLGHIEDYKGIKIHGLLGLQLFTRFEMIINYQTNTILLHRIGKREGKNYRHPIISTADEVTEWPIWIKDGQLLAHATIANKKLTFIVDTGAESNVLDSRLSNMVLSQVSNLSSISLAGSTHHKVEAVAGLLSSISFHQHQIKNIPVIITNLEKMSKAYQRSIDGMLGYDFLSNQQVGFNFVNNVMYLFK
jgi:predicted aspartyl protease